MRFQPDEVAKAGVKEASHLLKWLNRFGYEADVAGPHAKFPEPATPEQHLYGRTFVPAEGKFRRPFRSTNESPRESDTVCRPRRDVGRRCFR